MKNFIEKLRMHKKWFSNIRITSGIDPDKISALSVFLSIPAAVFIYWNSFGAAALLLLLVLMLDFLDGAISRGNPKRQKDAEADWIADRLSEFILFIPLFFISNLFILPLVLNILLTIAVSRGYLAILPLRHLIFIGLVYKIIF